jgi:hypothetical protein
MEEESGQNSDRKVTGCWSRRRAGRRWCCFSSSTTGTTAPTSHSTIDAGELVRQAAVEGGGVGAHLSLKVKEQQTRFYIVRC